MTAEPSDATADDEPHAEDPNRSDGGEVGALDEAPDGHTPLEATESDAGSLPPGASTKPE